MNTKNNPALDVMSKQISPVKHKYIIFFLCKHSEIFYSLLAAQKTYLKFTFIAIKLLCYKHTIKKYLNSKDIHLQVLILKQFKLNRLISEIPVHVICCSECYRLFLDCTLSFRTTLLL